MSTHTANKTGIRDFATIQDMTNRLPVIGQTVMWWMDGLTVPHPTLATAMDRHGLSEFLPKAPSPRTALHRALEAMLHDQIGTPAPALDEEGDAQVGKALIRTINDYNKEWLVFAIVAEQADLSKLSLGYATSYRIKLHKKTGGMVCVSSPEGNIDAEQEDHSLTRLLWPYYAKYRDLLTSRDLSLVIKAIIDWNSAITVRKTGGVYFVPLDNAPVLDQVRNLVADLQASEGGEPVFLTLGVPDEAETRRQMSFAVHHSLIREADELIAMLSETLKGTTDTRQNTWRSRIQTAMLFTMKMENYEFLLTEQQAELQGRRAKVKALLEETVLHV